MSYLNKPHREMTDEELQNAIDYWLTEINSATARGVVYSMACKEHQNLEAELKRRRVDKASSDLREVEYVPKLIISKLIEQYPPGTSLTAPHDGFAGTVIGYYHTCEGKSGLVLQQHGTRVVHVYGEKWFSK